MAAIGTIQTGIWRQRVQVRLLAYGAAAAMLALAAMTGHLSNPAGPIAIALAGLLFAIPARRFQTEAFFIAAAFDAVAILMLALIAGSALLGALTASVAALIMSVGRKPTTIIPVASLSGLTILVLMLVEQDVLALPESFPRLAAPADLVVTLVMATVVSVVGVTGVLRLLSLYHLAGARVTEAARMWWRFMDQSEQPMLVIGDGVIVRANQAAGALAGCDPKSLEATHIHTLVTEGSRIVRPDGTFAYVDVITTPLALEDGMTEVVFLTDITKRMDEHDDLRQSVEETDRFVASVSHEVRTPLTAVVGLSSLVDEAWDELSDDELREMVRIIATQSQDVSRIVEDLLVAARSGTIGIDVQSESVVLVDEVSRVLETLPHTEERIEVIGERRSQAMADAGRVRQIIRNLLTNAVRYGGNDIVVEVKEGGDHVTVIVSDDGEPIPLAVRERIFEPFSRGNGRKAHPDAVGLGLSASRQLAELMKGGLEYEHAAGRSRFVLTLPAVP